MRTLKELYFASPVYRWRLSTRMPRTFRDRLCDDFPGDAGRGRAILEGHIIYPQGTIRLAAEAPWEREPAEPGAAEYLHGFSWLRDLRALGGETARLRARELVVGWLARHDEWDALLWRPDILGSRLSSWIGNHDFFGASADDAFRNALIDSVGRQYRHLAGDIDASADGARRLLAARGLFAAIAATGEEERFGQALNWLHRELDRQVHPDGGHISRSPVLQASVLADLVDIRRALKFSGHEDERLDERIQAMTAVLRLLRHGDGGLAVFNHGDEGEIWLIDSLLAQAGTRRKSLLSAPDTGFERLVAGRTCLIMDTGKPSAADRAAHAGLLAFELSIGKQRMIVNCGASPADPQWDSALRATAAHSTLVVDDRNAAGIEADGQVGARPETVRATRSEQDGDMLVEAEHDGYLTTHGLRHHRRVYLSRGGDDLRVEDRLDYAGDPGTLPVEACIRLHLHPKVRASVMQSGSSALIRLPGGAGWRLRCDRGLALNESVYFGQGGNFQRCEQLVIRQSLEDIRTTGSVAIRWALRREDGKAPG